jgi:hypothetical protein
VQGGREARVWKEIQRPLPSHAAQARKAAHPVRAIITRCSGLLGWDASTSWEKSFCEFFRQDAHGERYQFCNHLDLSSRQLAQSFPRLFELPLANRGNATGL